jgi:hypothetical protein
MPKIAFNPALIRVILIVLFVVITQILAARKRANAPKPAPNTRKGSPLEVLRESMQKAPDQARAGQSKGQVDGTILEISQQLQQPSTIEPESSLIPSVLLVALFACLCLMAYRYWEG